jgi:hypothetical protein
VSVRGLNARTRTNVPAAGGGLPLPPPPRGYSPFSSSVISATEDFASPKSMAVLGL